MVYQTGPSIFTKRTLLVPLGETSPASLLATASSNRSCFYWRCAKTAIGLMLEKAEWAAKFLPATQPRWALRRPAATTLPDTAFAGSKKSAGNAGVEFGCMCSTTDTRNHIILERYFSPDIGEVFQPRYWRGLGEILQPRYWRGAESKSFRLEMGNMLETFSSGGCTPRNHLKESPCRHSSVVLSLFCGMGLLFKASFPCMLARVGLKLHFRHIVLMKVWGQTKSRDHCTTKAGIIAQQFHTPAGLAPFEIWFTLARTCPSNWHWLTMFEMGKLIYSDILFGILSGILWHSIWRSFWHNLTFCLALFLAYTLAFCLAVFQALARAHETIYIMFGQDSQ